MNILEAMKTRRSVRTYDGRIIPEQTLQDLTKRFEIRDRLCELKLGLQIFPSETIAHAMTGIIGSYGSMKNPPHYAVGLSEKGAGDQLNFGFALEQFILDCTQQGIGTCWIGGFFKLSKLNEVVAPKDNERIICITPLGYAAPRRFTERLMRSSGNLNRRKPMAERVFYKRWGAPADDFLKSNPTWLEIFECARWAPSASNLQPSHFVLDDHRVIISVLTTLYRKFLYSLIPDRAEGLNFQDVDGGISMSHIHLAAKELSIQGRWSLDFDEALLRKEYGIIPEAKILGVFDFE